jgi:uncharacterized membrane protein
VGSEAFAAERANFSITAKPNCSLTPNQRLWIFSAIVSFSLIVAMGFTLAGAWLVFPFAGMELLALGAAFYVVQRHSGDYESIVHRRRRSGDREACLQEDQPGGVSVGSGLG